MPATQEKSYKVGVWIDHREAIIVRLRSGDEEAMVERVRSGVPGKVRLSGGSRTSTPYGPQDASDESSAQRKRKQDLSKYCQRVIEQLEEADELYIFGPAQARSELADEIARVDVDLGSRIRRVEPAGKMTENQIAARTREFYHQRHPRKSA